MKRWLLGTALMSCAAHAVSMDLVPSAADREQVIQWRRDFHQHPELGNSETRSAARIVAALQAMGLKPETGLAKTGVVALIEGRSKRPLLALRADMDALPVTEATDLPFASKATATYRGEQVGVMHACGHDAHMAILLGVAKQLVAVRERLPGSVLLVFQPAEEGPPEGEEGGAELMLAEGLFAGDRKPDAMLGLHVWSAMNVGQIGLRGGPIMAGSDRFEIQVQGVQTHGSRPWGGVDPILASARIIEGLQSLVARRLDLTLAPAVVSVGAIKGGIRYNIIPDRVEMVGTIRTFDPGMRAQLHRDFATLVELTAQAHAATATSKIERHTPVNRNDPALTESLRPALAAVAGNGNLVDMTLTTGAEDFAFFAELVPSVYFFVGATPTGVDPKSAPSNHSPKFLLDEGALDIGVRAMGAAALRYFEVVEAR
jgi:amidohydrolase